MFTTRPTDPDCASRLRVKVLAPVVSLELLDPLHGNVLPKEPVKDTVGDVSTRAFSVSRRASSSSVRLLWICGRYCSVSAAHSLSVPKTAGICKGRRRVCGFTSLRPTNCSNRLCRTVRSFCTEISCAITRSNLAWASRVSVMVLVPTSKLRFAAANCSPTAAFCARTKAKLSRAASTSKYALLTRTIRSWRAVARASSTTAALRWAEVIESSLRRLYRVWLNARLSVPSAPVAWVV